MLWVSMLRYVEHNQSYFSVVLTLRRGVPRVARYLVRAVTRTVACAVVHLVAQLYSSPCRPCCGCRCACQIGVMPIFMAYTVFAVVYFGADTSRFSTFQDAFVALFAVLNGDVVRETFMHLIWRCAGVSTASRCAMSVCSCCRQCVGLANRVTSQLP